ncbi:act minimal PKS acyl carrier protein [Amycolatopsis xylanica]|uniref:Act minimal PKS acyl carrier protein n=1 Tax=Amycolatopsis xylanica TaxID=589385 RepID=A0A1H2VNZ8_9PSEU|nr:acyl carrier protein [Amycolatopsis xylanica]SDW70065.1 act minimal PKS acyl carrier protein [Amycolatopsis xylanica]
MAEFTLEALIAALREAAGEDEAGGLGGDILDTDFDELGYDSLALFNTVGKIERELGISLPDETVGEATTPRLLLRSVNENLGQRV